MNEKRAALHQGATLPPAVRLAAVAYLILLLAPPPIPSLTALIAGLVAFWASRVRRVAGTVLGAVIGLALGAGLHIRSHVVEGRAEPAGEFVVHVVLDASSSALIAGAVLAVVVGGSLRLAGARP